MRLTRTLRPVLAVSLAAAAVAATAGPAAADVALQHVVLISVDGLHANDLSRYIASHPGSALAGLSRSGTTYSAAHTPSLSDSFPGLLALLTGGTPRSTGVYYDDSYDRTYYPAGSTCTGTPGTETAYERLDRRLLRAGHDDRPGEAAA